MPELTATIDRFAGLSNRNPPGRLTRIESPELLNIDLGEDDARVRRGYSRQHANVLRDSSVRMDGVDDYLRIRHRSEYQVATRLYLAVDVVLRRFPTAAVTVVGKGFGTGADQFVNLRYDPTLNGNLGGWSVRIYDATGAALRTATVNDGNGGVSVPMNLYRHLEVYWNGTSNNYVLRVSASTVGDIGTSSAVAVGSLATSGQDWTVGVGMSAANTIGTDFADVTVAELRLGAGATVPVCNGIFGRELDPDAGETAGLLGYWRLNDGIGPDFVDRGTLANAAVAAAEGSKWTTNLAEVVGRSGLEFFGTSGFVYSEPGNAATVFNDNTAGGSDAWRTWAIDFCYTPKLVAGEATVRNGTLIWSGTNASNPAPFGVKVVSDNLIGYYQDGTSTKTTAPIGGGFTLSANAGKRIRVGLSKFHIGGVESVYLYAFVEGSVTGSVSSGSVVLANNNPASVSAAWSIGGVLASTTFPITATETPVGVISDVYVVDRILGAIGSPIPPSVRTFATMFQPLGNLGPGQIGSATFADVIAWSVKLQDGAGNRLTVQGTNSGAFATRYPEDGQGWRPDVGLVDPVVGPQIRAVGAFKRRSPRGDFVRFLYALAGTTFYEIDEDAAEARPLDGSFYKGTVPATVTQYADTIYVAEDNGRRPRKITGSAAYDVGIAAPFQTPVATTSDVGGSLPTGSYVGYVTYRNRDTGAESNPSPPFLFSIGAGNTGRITQLAVPASADLQVKERRVWLTVAGAGAGTTAYLVATIGDNVTTTYTTAISSLSLTAATLTYSNNAEPPAGSVVQVFKERLFVVGAQQPTRVYYSVTPNQLEGFNVNDLSTPSFLDLDLDSGDPVVALVPLLNRLIAHARDGAQAIDPTGDADAPFALFRLDTVPGVVGPHGLVASQGVTYILADHDIYAWNGSTPENITSPDRVDYPSVQETLLNGMNRARWRQASLAVHRRQKQLWLAFSSAGASANDRVLVFDLQTRVFSLYTLDADVLGEAEDSDDAPFLYAGIQGFVCKLDTGDADGLSAAVSGTATSGTTTSITSSTASYTAGAYRGLRIYWYDVDADVVRSALIKNNTATTITFQAATTAPASGDPFIIGAFPAFLDFYIDGDNPHMEKRLFWLTLSGRNEGSAPVTVRFQVLANQKGREPDMSPAQSYTTTFATTDTFRRVGIGGRGRNYRVRLSVTGHAAANTDLPMPAVSSRMAFESLQIVMGETMAP
jgi:hypothetical protein